MGTWKKAFDTWEGVKRLYLVRKRGHGNQREKRGKNLWKTHL